MSLQRMPPDAPAVTSHTPTILVLFDIDGTLLDTQDAGILAYERAGTELLGKYFDYSNITVHGRLDSENFRSGMNLHAPDTPSDLHLIEFKAKYHDHLKRIGIERGGFEVLSGVHELVDSLHKDERIEVGILTGNWAHTGMLKIEASGLDPALFHTSAWAEDGDTREDLVPVAVERFVQSRGVAPQRVIIIGDTPRDVECAHAHHAEAIAVASGVHDYATLIATGAECVVETLTERSKIQEFLEKSP